MEDNFFTKLSEMVQKLKEAKEKVDKNTIEGSHKKFIDETKKLKIKSSGYDLISSKENRNQLSSLLKKVFNNKAINNVMENFINNTDIDLKEFKEAKNEYNSVKQAANALRKSLQLFKREIFRIYEKCNKQITPTFWNELKNTTQKFLAQIIDFINNKLKTILGLSLLVRNKVRFEIFKGKIPSLTNDKELKKYIAEIIFELLNCIKKVDETLLDKAQAKSKFYNDKSQELKALAEFIEKTSSPKNFSKGLNQEQIKKIKSELDKIKSNIELEADNLIKKNMLDKKTDEKVVYNIDTSKVEKDLGDLLTELFGNSNITSEKSFENQTVSSNEIFGENGFDKWNPKIEDIEQGNLGDCYLLAALLSLCKSNPDLIKDCFSGAENVDESGKIGIKFYKIQLTYQNGEYTATPQGRITIEVDSTILVEKGKLNARFSNKRKKWVNMFEKAYIKYINTVVNIIDKDDKSKEYISNFRKRIVTLKLSPTTIEGTSSSFIPLAAITGKPYICIENIKGTLPQEISNKIKNFDKNKNMTIAFNRDAVDKVLLENQALVANHAYSVTEVEVENKDCYVYLDNPYHSWYFDLTCLPDDLSGNLDWINNCFKIIGIDDNKSQKFIEEIDEEIILKYRKLKYKEDENSALKWLQNLSTVNRYEFVKKNIIGIMTLILEENPKVLEPFLKKESIEAGKSVKLRLNQIKQTPNLIRAIDYN